MQYDLIILGAGPAGLSAAIYGVRAGLSTLVIEQGFPGSQITYTPDIVNYPGIATISGEEFIQTLSQQALRLGAQIVYESIQKIDLKGSPKLIETNQAGYQARGVILAVGARHRKLDCKGEETFQGKGVSYCAACDGNFFKDRTVCVVGGGNTALEEALYLSKICKKVYLIHRRSQFRGSRSTADMVSHTPNIQLMLEYEVTEILGNQTVESVRLQSTANQTTKELDVSGVFIAVGLQPENQLFQPWITLDSGGYILAGEDCRTNLPLVYAAGDTRTKEIRQLVTAAADGAIAATHLSRDLEVWDQSLQKK